MSSDEFSFDKFSKNDFYSGVNARLVDMVNLKPGQRIVDLACGTGGVTRLIVDRVRGARESVIIAIDHSSTALKQAAENLKDARNAALEFVQSRVEQMSETVKESADTIFYCNAIHYVPDKDALLAEVSKSLKPGGKLAFNTSFYEGAQPLETQKFYRKWMFKAAIILRREHGLKPTRTEKVESRKYLTPGQYRTLLERHQLHVVREEIDKVLVPIEGWLDISSFEDFITGTMPGVPLDKARDALQRGVQQAFSELKIKNVVRNWLDVVAVRV